MFLKKFFIVLVLVCPVMHIAWAEERQLNDVTISFLAVNGGQDTANPGTTCFKVSTAVSATCPGGYIAIPNNNEQLVSAALTAKASGSKLWLYYEDSVPNPLHCPGLQFTPCSAITIAIR